MPTVEELQQDKDFMSANPADQQRYLMDKDPDFKSASAEDQAAYLAHVSNAPTGATPSKGLLETAEQTYQGPGVVSALGRLGTMVPSMAKQAYHAAVDEPKTDEERAIAEKSMLGPGESRAIIAAKRLVYDPMEQTWKHVDEMARAQEARAKEKGQEVPFTGKLAEAGGKALAHIPLVGPYALGLGERAGKGDVSGALTEAAGVSLAPEIAEEAMPGGADR